MADDIVEDQITELIEAYIAYLDGDGPAPSLGGLDPVARREARNAFRAVDAAWRSDIEIPPLDEDPVALALGFVAHPAPAPVVFISGKLVKHPRRRSGLKASDVAKRMQSAGLQVDHKWVVRLEQSPVQEVAPDVATGLAHVFGVSADALSSAQVQDVDPFAAWLYSDQFDAAFAEWVDEQEGRALPDDLAPVARSKLLVAARRSEGDGGGPALWVQMLRSVLDELS